MNDQPPNPVTDEDILQGIIEQLDKGVLPWRKPWAANMVVIGSLRHYANDWPSNLRAPKVPFGIYNGVMLTAQAVKQGYRSNLWVTQGVVKELRATLVDKDNKPVSIRRDSRQGGDPLVYNIDQIENCEKVLGFTFLERNPTIFQERYESSEKLLRKLVKDHGLKIVHENYAAYSPSWDFVMMPDIHQFFGTTNYWATLWHEVVHWTGHHSRLNRERHSRWGDGEYAFEELVAEFGAAFLCAHLGVDGELQHASYLNSWCRGLREDKGLSLLKAAKLATAAKNYTLHGKLPKPGINPHVRRR